MIGTILYMVCVFLNHVVIVITVKYLNIAVIFDMHSLYYVI